MRHFMAQFGPALQWPWTRLTDVPELTDALLDRIVEQSDAQAAGRSVRELERVRDDCLVAILQAPAQRGLRGRQRPGALRARALRPRARRRRRPATTRRCACTATASARSGSTTTATRTRAATCSCSATRRDALLRHVGVDAAYLEAGGSYFTVETHLAFLHEARAGQEVLVETQVLGHDAKRLLLFHRLLLAARRVASSPPPSSSCCTSTRPRAAPRPPASRCWSASPPSRSATPPCPAPRPPVAASRWSGAGRAGVSRPPERPAGHGRPARGDRAPVLGQPRRARAAPAAPGRGGRRLRARLLRLAAVRAVAGRADDRRAALAHRRLRQRGRAAGELADLRPRLRLLGYRTSSRARCTSSAPTSCTASRSG